MPTNKAGQCRTHRSIDHPKLHSKYTLNVFFFRIINMKGSSQRIKQTNVLLSRLSIPDKTHHTRVVLRFNDRLNHGDSNVVRRLHNLVSS